MKKFVVFTMILTLSMSLLSGCGKKEEAPASPDAAQAESPETSPEAEANKEADTNKESDTNTGTEQKNQGESKVDLSEYTIGMSMHFMMDDWAKVYTEAFKKKCDELGIQYEIADGNNDPEKQLNDLIAFKNMGVDGIGILPLDAGAISGVCDDFAAADVPVIPTADISDTCKIACYSDGGQWDKGNVSGEALKEALGGKGKVIVLTQPALSTTLEERQQGLEDALKDTQIEIVDTKLATTSEEAMNVVNDLLTSGEEFDAIWGSLGTVVLGAGEALKAKNVTDKMIFGVDADYSILQLIRDGYVTSVAAQFPSATAENIINAMIRIWNGEELSGPIQEDKTRVVVKKDNVEEMCKEIWNRELE